MDIALSNEIIALLDKKLNSKSELQESVEDSINKIRDSAKDIKAVNDSYGNSLLAIGTDDKVQTFTNYGFSNDTLNWTLWLALYNDSWVFKRAIDKPAQDEIRCGITLQGDDENQFDSIYKHLKRFRFDLIQLLQWGALFGGSIAVMLFDNLKDADYADPMNMNVIRKSKKMRMYVVDRWYGVAPSSETVDNMLSLDFGKPKYYDVTFTDGKTLRVHHDYVLRYEHRVAPKLVKMGMLQGWGYAEGSHILNELTRDDKLKSSIQSLIDKSLIEVIKMSGMRGVFMGADDGNEEQLRKRLEMVNWGRSFNSLTFLDKDDEYSQNTYGGLSGLADILEKNMWLIAAALEMQGVLFGDLKGGFSQDVEALERYDETINARCESYVRPVYDKLLKVLFAIHNIKGTPEYEFNSLLSTKQDKDRMEGLKDYVALLSQMLSDGVLSTKLYGQAIQTFINKGVLDLGLTEEELNKLDDKISEEMESIDIDTDKDVNYDLKRNVSVRS